MTRRRTVLCAVVVVVAFTRAPHAQSGLPGTWKTAAPTLGLAGARLFQQDLEWRVQAFGQCEPSPSDWGAVPFTFLTDAERKSADRGFATWKRDDGSAHVLFRLDGRELTAEVYRLHSAAPAPSNRLRNYFVVVRLVRDGE